MWRSHNKDRLQDIFDELDRLLNIGNWPRRIELCREALTLVSREEKPELWAKLLDDLATSLAQDTQGDRARNLERAIRYYRLGLKVRTRQTNPKEWASRMNNLATAYRNRICGEPADNIETAIQYYQESLDERIHEPGSEKCVITLNSLGNAYMTRIRGERAQNIEKAITYYSQALEVDIRPSLPNDWASLHYNLGDAYRCRIRGDQLDNIERAINHFHQALEVHTRTAYPKAWAKARNDLGNAHLARIRGDRAVNIERAIYHIIQSLNVYSEQAYPQEWAGAQNNLGNAYLGRIRGDRIENIEKAIQCYNASLKVRTRTSFPKDWAETLSNLAGVERTLANESIERSIERLQQVLEVRTRDTSPYDWAETQNNLAIAYTNRINGDRAENIQQAIKYYEQALEVYTLAMPGYCLRAARALGNLAFEQQYYELARRSYQKAFDARDMLLHDSLSRASKQTELGEAQNLPPRAAYAHVKCNDVQGAIQVLEKGRAQLMRESLERRWLDELPDLGFGELRDNYRKAVELYDVVEKMGDAKNTWVEIQPLQLEQASAEARSAVTAIQEIAGEKHPQYRYFTDALSFDEIQKQVQEKIIVYLCSTSAGGLALIVDENGEQAIELSDLDQASLQKQIWSPTDKEVDRINEHINKQKAITHEDIQAVSGGYFSAYSLWSLSTFAPNTSDELLDELTSAWFNALDKITGWLWGAGIGKLVDALKTHNKPVVFIPVGQLAMLPLHAAWKEDPSRPVGRLYVLDELNISYAPSVHALWQASLSAGQPIDKLLVVDNPDGTLHFAEQEVNAIRNLSSNCTHLHGKQATVQAVKTAMLDANVLHFATHGNAGWQEEEQARLKLANDYLTLPDIFDLKLKNARLAVLSACETGVPSLKLIDEMFGLPAGMMQAGVPGVVGSLWSVRDGSTSLLMSQFYRSWQRKGKTPQDALKQAQMWLRDNLFEEPYYWAAFTYTGV